MCMCMRMSEWTYHRLILVEWPGHDEGANLSARYGDEERGDRWLPCWNGEAGGRGQGGSGDSAQGNELFVVTRCRGNAVGSGSRRRDGETARG